MEDEGTRDERKLLRNRSALQELLWASIVLVGLCSGWILAVRVAGFDGIGMLACL